MKKDLLKLLDLSGEDITDILDLADQLKYEKKQGLKHHRLTGKTLAMIFEKASTRTRVSFEAGMYQLGGHAQFLSGKELQLGRGESIQDTARVLSRYVDGIMIRTFAQDDVEELAKYATVPVINGLTDFAHPCQILADLMTIREIKGRLDGIKIAYIGDGNNMANSIIVGGLKTGMRVSVACPEAYRPHGEVMNFAGNSSYNDMFNLTSDPVVAAQEADVVVTDVWSSMGMESEIEARKKAFKGYCVDKTVMKAANPSAMVLHCLPAHKGEEITEEVFEAHAGEIFEEAENRLHAQKAILVKLLA